MKSLENQVFIWGGWDQHDTATFGFYDISLTVPVGPYPVGEEFAYAVWCGEKSTLDLYKTTDQKEPSYTGKIRVTVG